MDLAYPFSNETRWLYLYAYSCWMCGSNGTMRGGLELHHIYGRKSDSPFNSALLCGFCHRGISHNRQEHITLMQKTIEFLAKSGYGKLTKEDERFFFEVAGLDILGIELSPFIR